MLSYAQEHPCLVEESYTGPQWASNAMVAPNSMYNIDHNNSYMDIDIMQEQHSNVKPCSVKLVNLKLNEIDQVTVINVRPLVRKFVV